MNKYTLVQHSGFAWGDNPEFARAVETRSINDKEEAIVRGAGGVVFDDYTSADAGEYAANYPDDGMGLMPLAKGSFHTLIAIDGLALFIPAESSVVVDG